MAGHTFIAKAKAFLAGLFRRPKREAPAEAPAKGQTIPLHILDGVCCGCSAVDMEVQDYLYSLRLRNEYRKPRPLDCYLCDEEGITLGEFNARKRQRMEERIKEIRDEKGIRPPRAWSYDSYGNPVRSASHA